MDKNNHEESFDATPPYFKSWRPVYWIVVANIALIIILLHLFFSTK